METNIKAEKWVSSENQSEIHYFLENNVYLLGYNPKYVKESDILEILGRIEIPDSNQ